MLRTSCIVFGIVCILVDFGNGLKLPSYIKPCSKSDPNIDECFVREARNSIPTILKGDPKFHIPSLLPLVVPEIKLTANKNLKVTLRDSTITGLETVDVKSMKVDLPHNYLKNVMTLKKFDLIGTYELDGQILVLPISGKGKYQLSFTGAEIETEYALNEVKRDGISYLKVSPTASQFNCSKAQFQFDNLFNGNKQLGDNMNKILNENWKAVMDELGNAHTQVIVDIALTLINGYLDRVPYHDALLD